jgi:phage terminase large subunit GpA-like protein
MLDAEKVYLESFREGILPDLKMTVSEWADKNRMLSAKASAEAGHWRTERTPFLREIMDCLSPSSPIQNVVFMKGAQVGGTEAGNNWVGSVIDYSPGPMLIVQPTVELAKRMSKQRLAPMIDETPVLRRKISNARSRDSGNTMQVKEFPGGMIMLVGANSAVGLRSMPIRFLFMDEIDAYPFDVNGEGDPANLAERRTTTFSRKKIYKCSTPKIKDISRIERALINSDNRRYFVPCPHCGNFDWIKWKNITWEDRNPETATLKCESCGALIEERFKTTMLSNGYWQKGHMIDDPDKNGAQVWELCDDPDCQKLTAGFHLSSLYSPLGWKSWADIVKEFLESKDDPPLLKEWTNTVLGETWEDNFAVKVATDSLKKRCENYDSLFAPSGVLCVTAGIDVQDNRLAVVLRGWGREEESWLLYHTEIFGDPAQNEVWDQLDEILFKPIKHELGATVPIYVSCVDSGGHYTNEVYNYTRARKNRHVVAVKGSSIRNKPALSKPNKVDFNFKGKTVKSGAEVSLVGTDTIKSTIYARLKLKERGPGYYHFYETVSAEYFEQLTAEKQITKYIRGFPIREWMKKDSARNEALDCEVYAYAALQHLFMRFNRKTIWDQLEKRIRAPELVLPEPVKSVEPVEEEEEKIEEESLPSESVSVESAPLPRLKTPVNVAQPRRNFVSNF